MSDTETIRIAFVCVQNAGRSQMAYACAEQELVDRGLRDAVQLITGGTNPADRVHPEVIEVMGHVGIDLSERRPREVTVEELQDSDYVITMGCSADNVCPAGWAGKSRDWDLDDPHEKPVDQVAEIRDEIRYRVSNLFDEMIQN